MAGLILAETEFGTDLGLGASEVYESSALFWDAWRNGNLLDFRLGVMYKNRGRTGIPPDGIPAGWEQRVRIYVQALDRVPHGLCACVPAVHFLSFASAASRTGPRILSTEN